MKRWGEIDETNERAETLSKMSDNLHIGPSVMRLRDLEDRLISKFIRKFYDEVNGVYFQGPNFFDDDYVENTTV